MSAPKHRKGRLSSSLDPRVRNAANPNLDPHGCAPLFVWVAFKVILLGRLMQGRTASHVRAILAKGPEPGKHPLRHSRCLGRGSSPRLDALASAHEELDKGLGSSRRIGEQEMAQQSVSMN